MTAVVPCSVAEDPCSVAVPGDCIQVHCRAQMRVMLCSSAFGAKVTAFLTCLDESLVFVSLNFAKRGLVAKPTVASDLAQSDCRDVARGARVVAAVRWHSRY